jgi:leucyl aminopeptidase
MTILAMMLGKPASPATECGYNPLIAGMLSQTSEARWADWISKLSGETPVQVSGQTVSIQSRHTRRMFSGDPAARAFDYVQELLNGWLGERARFEVDPFLVYKPPEEVYNAQNLIVDIPGVTRPAEIVVLSAHLDSISTHLTAPAPGADDNASGVAAVLEAARLFRQYRFARTIRLILFTGEEQHELGSRAYLADHPPKGVVGVINLDMIAYDKDQDHCLEIQTSTLPASQPIAQCLIDTIPAYHLDLKTETVTAGSSIESDQSSFWAYGVGAVLLWENVTIPIGAGACPNTDTTPYYHSANDRLEHLNRATGFATAQAGIAAVAGLAQPLALCRDAECQDAPNLDTAHFWEGLQYSVQRAPMPPPIRSTPTVPAILLPAPLATSTATPAYLPARVNVAALDVWNDPRNAGNIQQRETQLLLGERVLILQTSAGWAQIVAVEQPSHKHALGYPGWVRAQDLTPDWEESEIWAVVMIPRVEILAQPTPSAGPVSLALFDTRLAVSAQKPGWVEVHLPDGRGGWIAQSGVRLSARPDEPYQLNALLETAQMLTGTPYAWGGAAPNAFDCSGFIYRLFHAHGLRLARDAQDQALLGLSVPNEALVPGDLLFYASTPGGPITHVALSAGNGQMFDAALATGLTRRPMQDIAKNRVVINARRVSK